VGNRDLRFRNNLAYISGPAIAIIGAIVVTAAFVGGVGRGAVALGLVGLVAYLALRTPYKATLGADNRLVFRSHLGRKQCWDIEDLRQIERKTGHEGVSWVFSFVDGSSQLGGEAGRELAQVLCELNPRVVASADPRSADTTTFFKVAGAQAGQEWVPWGEKKSARAEPEWVRRGEKRSAQDLARQDREASRELASSSHTEGSVPVSGTSHGPGCWQASDGRWYPPQSKPARQAPPSPLRSVVGSGQQGSVYLREQDLRRLCPCGCGRILTAAAHQIARRAMYIDSLLPAYEYLERQTGEDHWKQRFEVGQGYSAGFWAAAHSEVGAPVAIQEAESWEAQALFVAMRLNQEDQGFRALWPGPYADKTRWDSRRW
jgi:hypothetical protein